MDDYLDYDFEDDQWLYVEDHYDLPDELAESTCPEPYTFDYDDYFDYDPFDYWEDLAYLSDARHDHDKNGTGAATVAKAKRRRNPRDAASNARKNKQSERNESVTKPRYVRNMVVWRSAEDGLGGIVKAPIHTPEQRAKAPRFALFKDWRTRFASSRGFDTKAMQLQSRSGAADKKTQVGEKDAQAPKVQGEGFDVNDMQSVAALLSGENLSQIQEMLKKQGMDPDAVQTVLGDLISGAEPEFEEDDEEAEDGNDELQEVDPAGFNVGGSGLPTAPPQEANGGNENQNHTSNPSTEPSKTDDGPVTPTHGSGSTHSLPHRSLKRKGSEQSADKPASNPSKRTRRKSQTSQTRNHQAKPTTSATSNLSQRPNGSSAPAAKRKAMASVSRSPSPSNQGASPSRPTSKGVSHADSNATSEGKPEGAESGDLGAASSERRSKRLRKR
ncbi:MAG: hypothetical protein M1831_001292 [Alyxoria varia]|nr:MAG: hypothetical protein M1831_001292 [Alyxoria varia]